MKMQLIGIFDRKAQAFVEISATPAVAVALRNFTEAVNTKSESPVYKWPGDFELRHLAVIEMNNGAIQHLTLDTTITSNDLIVCGDNLKTTEQ